jgi:Fur family ferric uptake transcriptional regulator
VILEELRASGAHLTADELYERVRRRVPRISLGTVYRNLEILSDCGLIRKLGPETSQMRFDGRVSAHYHVRCLRCGRIEDVFIEPFEELGRAAESATDFRIVGYTLEFEGVCPACECRSAAGGERDRR